MFFFSDIFHFSIKLNKNFQPNEFVALALYTRWYISFTCLNLPTVSNSNRRLKSQSFLKRNVAVSLLGLSLDWSLISIERIHRLVC